MGLMNLKFILFHGFSLKSYEKKMKVSFSPYQIKQFFLS